MPVIRHSALGRLAALREVEDAQELANSLNGIVLREVYRLLFRVALVTLALTCGRATLAPATDDPASKYVEGWRARWRWWRRDFGGGAVAEALCDAIWGRLTVISVRRPVDVG